MVSWILGVIAAIAWASSVQAQDFQSQPDDAWYRLPQCPVLVERVLPVPALESGVITNLHVELNASVAQDGLLATLDTELAQTELGLAKLQYTAAKELAADNSDVEFHEVALKQVELELENHQQLMRNVSDSEIRRLKLAVGKAELALTRAQQAKAQAILAAQIKYASIGLAQEHVHRREVRAPIQGVVSKVICQAGQWVEAGQPIVEVKELSRLMVDRLVPASSINLATLVGSAAYVEIPTIPRTVMSEPQPTDAKFAKLPAVVTSYDPEISAQGHIRIHVRVTNQEVGGRWLLLPGMNVDLLLAKEHVLNAEQARQAQSASRIDR